MALGPLKFIAAIAKRILFAAMLDKRGEFLLYLVYDKCQLAIGISKMRQRCTDPGAFPRPRVPVLSSIARAAILIRSLLELLRIFRSPT